MSQITDNFNLKYHWMTNSLILELFANFLMSYVSFKYIETYTTIANIVVSSFFIFFNLSLFLYLRKKHIYRSSIFIDDVGGGLLHITRILSSVDKLYPTEKANLISQFKLDANDTNFCTSGHDVTGFISSGICCTEKGVVYKDILLNKEDVINYLKTADIPFSALDDNHVKVLTMYNY